MFWRFKTPAEWRYRPRRSAVAVAAMLVDALHPALEHGIEALDSVGMDDAAPMLARRVANKIMFGKYLSI